MKHLLALALLVGVTAAPAPPPSNLSALAQQVADCNEAVLEPLFASNEALERFRDVRMASRPDSTFMARLWEVWDAEDAVANARRAESNAGFELVVELVAMELVTIKEPDGTRCRLEE